MGEDHAKYEHCSEEQRLALVPSFGHIGEGDRNGSESNWIEAERKAGEKSNACRGKPRVFDRLAQRFRIHYTRAPCRSISASRSWATVGVELKTSSPSMTMDVITPSSTA